MRDAEEARKGGQEEGRELLEGYNRRRLTESNESYGKERNTKARCGGLLHMVEPQESGKEKEARRRRKTMNADATSGQMVHWRRGVEWLAMRTPEVGH